MVYESSGSIYPRLPDVNTSSVRFHPGLAAFLVLPVLLAVPGCIGTAPNAEGPNMPAPSASAFRNPPPAYRILRINHGWAGEETARIAYVDKLRRQGFGGAVTNVGFGGGYVTSPTQWQAFHAGIDRMREAGLELWLYDEAGYPSGRAGGLVLEGHPEREARALLATSTRVEVRADGVRNIGPQARVSASSTDPARGIYDPKHAVDGNTDTRDWHHWSNDPDQAPSAETPQWLLLRWDRQRRVREVIFHTMAGYATQDYAIETWDGVAWKLFADADVRDNTMLVRTHAAPVPVDTDQLRVLCLRGSRSQPGIARIVEIEVMAEAVADDPEPRCTLAVPPGDLRFARAFREGEDGGVVLDGAIDLPAPSQGTITWTAPPGRWRLLAVSEDRLFAGSQVDFSGVPKHAPYVNLLDEDTVSAFLRITHDAYARELGPDLGSRFVSTFTDEPSLLACYYGKAMPWSPVAWHPRLASEYARRTGRELATDLPLLFVDGAGAARVRYGFWGTVGDTFRENYFGRIRQWCHAHDIPSGGHLLLEEDIRWHVPLYGDLFACLREMDVPGIDVLSCDPAKSPWYTARLASSAAELEGGALVMSETSDFVEMWAKPPRPVSAAQFRGTINRLLLGGVNRFNTYSRLRGLADADLVQLNEWTGRCSLALTGGVRQARIGVLYPIESAWTRFKPSPQGTRDAGPLAARLAATIRQVDNLLYASRREFSYLDARTLAEGRVTDGELRLRQLAWSVIVLPDADTLSTAAWKNLYRFWQDGGVIIAAGALPVNSECEFPSAARRARNARMFGLRPNGDGEAPAWGTNARGGIGIYLPPGCVDRLPALLDLLLAPDLVVSDGAVPVRLARRAIRGQDVCLLINDSPERWQGNVTFGAAARTGDLLDPATGELVRLAAAANVPLDLDGWGAVIVRLDGVSPVTRRPLDALGLAQILADPVPGPARP